MMQHRHFSVSAPISTRQDILNLARLAGEIWREYFPPLIGRDQVEYMLAQFQSATAIEEQIVSGAIYAYILEKNKPIGYISVVQRSDDDTLFLSKFYLKQPYRGRGAGYIALCSIQDMARAVGVRTITLTVNRHNRLALDAYRRMGFEIIGEKVTDIGGGYIMDDYQMSLTV